MIVEPATERSAREQLLPYVPRLVLDWLANDPATRYRRVPGSLVFADISGFTKLAERLAKKGRVGAEELSDTLDRTFTELLGAAYEYGAGVVKWGGDAVLLLFDGEGHEERACRGAAEMQRTIRRIGRLRTEAGTVVLRMSLGINSGAFDFFLVGDSHRELLVAGPAATATVGLESAADAGDVLISAVTAAALPARHVGSAKGPGVLLRGAPPAEQGRVRTPAGVETLPIERCLPVEIRRHLLTTDREPEHRTIGVAFVEFRHTDDLVRVEGGDAVAEALHECIAAVQDSVERHGVTFHETDISGDGGKILLLSGAPRSAGDEEERVLRAARAIVDAGVRLPLRIGVNTGPVFSGDFGPPYRRTFSVKGDAVNLAARLLGKAQSGQIVAADAVVRQSRTRFELDEIEPFFVKGKSKPIVAHRVGDVLGERGRAELPLVGREAELDALLEARDSAREWSGRYVEIAGPAGIGKSRLLDELRDRADGFTVVSAACVEYEKSTPYFPLRAPLRELLGLSGLEGEDAADRLRAVVTELAPHLLTWLPLLALPLHVDVGTTPEVNSLEDEFRRTRLEETVQELLGLGLLAPTLLIVEDVHWMDDASRELVRMLVDHVEDRPWLIVATTRDRQRGLSRGGTGETTEIDLTPLGDGDALRLLEETTADAPLLPHQLEVLRERAGGNPLYLHELLSTARTLGDGELPDSVGGAITAQIDRLPPPDRTLLRRVAVLGSSFDARMLEAVAPDVSRRELRTRLGDFIDADGRRVRFRHALVRDTAYEGLPYRRRRELHGIAGEALERQLGAKAEEEAALLSLHFYEAQLPAPAWRYSRVAGEAAKSLYANVEAETFLGRAVEVGRRLDGVEAPELAAALESLSEVRTRLGDHDHGAVALREARRLRRGDPAETARLELREGQTQWRRGRHVAALRWVRRGLRTLDGVTGPDAERQRADLYVWQGTVRLRQGRTGETVEWCRRAIDAASGVDAREPLAHAYYVLDYALVSLGRPDEAVYSERALAIYDELGMLDQQAGVLNNLGIFAYFQGRWDESVEYYRRAEEVWERAGNRWLASFATTNRGELLSDQGRLAEAEPLFRQALRVARAAGSAARVADIDSHYGRLAARAHRFDEARELLEESLAEYESTGARSEALLVETRLAECLLLEGRSKKALSRAEAALEATAQLEGVFALEANLLRVVGSAAVALGRTGKAREAFARSLACAREHASDYELALTAAGLAPLLRAAGELDEAAALEAERDAVFQRLGIADPATLTLSSA